MSQGLIQGSMREAPLPDIIQLVSQGGKSGCFHVTDEPKRAKIYLRDGKLTHAISHESQGLDAIYEVALWLDGTYHFEEGSFDVPASITKSNAAVLMEMHRRMDEWRVISLKITSLDLYPASTLLPGDVAHGVNPRQAKLLNLLTGWYTVAELAEVMQKPVLTVAKELYDLVMGGFVVLKGLRGGKRPEFALESGNGSTPPPAPESKLPIAEAKPLFVEPPSIEPSVESTPSGFPLAASPAESVKLVAAPIVDPVKITKLIAFAQRIASTARNVLPPQHHAMVSSLFADASVKVNAGEGPDAVKNLALAISRGAVDAGCDGDVVKMLNAQLKALFSR